MTTDARTVTTEEDAQLNLTDTAQSPYKMDGDSLKDAPERNRQHCAEIQCIVGSDTSDFEARRISESGADAPSAVAPTSVDVLATLRGDGSGLLAEATGKIIPPAGETLARDAGTGDVCTDTETTKGRHGEEGGTSLAAREEDEKEKEKGEGE